MSMAGRRYPCTCARPRLLACIRGRLAPVSAAFAGDPLSRLYYARCALCHGRYVGPWRLDGRPPC